MKLYIAIIGIIIFSSILTTPVFGAVTDNANWSSITWTSATQLTAYNVTTSAYQSFNSSTSWGPFSVATWVSYFGSFDQIRIFETSGGDVCSALSITECGNIATDEKDYWVDGTNWTATDPNPPEEEPVATTTDPLSRDEWLYVIMIFIVILGVPFWRFIFGGWNKENI